MSGPFAPWRRRTRAQGRGQSLVEFALVFPLMMLLLFGLIDLGRLVYANNALAEAAREAARWGSVQARSVNDIADIEAMAVDRATGITGVTATATCVKRSSDSQPCMQFDTLEVTARADVGMITPLIAQLMNAAGLNPFEIEATADVLINN